MTRRAIAVIGAGIVGCLAAADLAARYPDALITVLDRDGIGSGASRRSAGLFLPRGATARVRRMSAHSHAHYSGLAARHPQLPIRPVAATVITDGAHGDPVAAGYLPDLAAPAPVSGPPNQVVSIPDGSRAWTIGGCHYADVYSVTQALAASLRPRVRFREGVFVTGLDPGANSVTVSCRTGERVVADSVILAPGPWLGVPAWRDLLAPLGLRVKKIVAVHIERRPAPGDGVVFFESDDAFLLPLHDRGHWLFSYTCQEWDVQPDGLVDGLSPADVAAARACLRRYSPAMAQAASAGRVFCDAYSSDREPTVQPLDEAGRIVFAGGSNGSGYRLAPAIGSEASELLDLALSGGATGDHQYV